METRKVTIINSKTQSQTVINDSKATTLGELKAEAREKGVDFADMTWFEGHMRAELKDDASPLPTNIPYKGQVVNDLVFMLTTPEKKVKSGVMTRAEAYDKIKELNLQDAIKVEFGKNFTQCPTADLIKFLSNNEKSETLETPKASDLNNNITEAIVYLASILHDNEYIDGEDYYKIVEIINGERNKEALASEKKMSQKEIDSMFDFLD